MLPNSSHGLPTSGSVAQASFTSGSIPFANASGSLIQDNANLQWDDTNNQLVLGLGTGTAPSYSFTGDQNTGMFSNAADNVTLTAGGNSGMRVVYISDAIGSVSRAGGGSAAFPGLSFMPDVDSGFYSIGADSMGVTVGGVLRWTLNTTNITFADAIDIVFNATTGTKIGTATTQKLAFYGATPIVQGASVADAAGGATIDAEARTALNALISRIEATGLIATV